MVREQAPKKSDHKITAGAKKRPAKNLKNVAEKDILLAGFNQFGSNYCANQTLVGFDHPSVSEFRGSATLGRCYHPWATRALVTAPVGLKRSAKAVKAVE